MFYPVESLKRGGRFYLCWVADSWPLRFAAITHRQLWSQDIRKLCDDLKEVVNNESGRPINRFSLRLSSQLMRGLVRLYERKVTVFLGDLCMIHANVFKHSNKKLMAHEATSHVHRPLPQLQRVQEVMPDQPANAQTVEEMLQNSGNIVTNIQDITLKEAAIPDFQLPPNDGFGEEHPDQALQLLGDRTVEMMLLQADSSAAGAHSGLEPPLDKSAERSHDKSRLLLPEQPQMERISEHDVTLFRKSTAEGLQPPEETEKDLPATPVLPPPAATAPAPAPAPEPETAPEPAPVPELDKQIVEPMVVEEVPIEEPAKDQPEPPQEKQPEKEPEIELEELEEGQAGAGAGGRKRRARRHLIIDKRIKLGAAFMRARLDNPRVELRCEDSSDDIVEVRVPWELLARRPARAGARLRTNMAGALLRLYQTRLLTHGTPYEERERALPEPPRQPRAVLEEIVEEQEPVPPMPAPVEQMVQSEHPITEGHVSAVVELNVTAPPDTTAEPNVMAPRDVTAELNVTAPRDVTSELNVTAPRDVTSELNVTAPRDVTSELNVTAPRDVSGKLDMTGPLEQRPAVEPMEQEIYDLPTQKLEVLKRTSEYEISAKRPRLSGSLGARKPDHQEIDKENIPPEQEQSRRVSQRLVSTLLQEAGLADALPRHEVVETQALVEPQVATETRRKQPSENSETPLGSLDRTKVSLGDSVKTTDSQRFIRNEWGIEGTMIKILKGIKASMNPITVETLIEKGPVISGYKTIIAARCFTSILKLKQHSFIKIVKDPETLEISDIKLGTMFDGVD